MSAVRPSTHSAGLTGTLLAHGLAVAVAILVARRAPGPPPVVYAVELVAAPAPTEAPRRAAAEATPTAQEETAPILPPKPKTKPKPEPVKQVPRDAKVAEKAPITKSETKPLPGETPSTGQDVVTLKQAGIQFPYPEYLRNITNKIYARWRQPLVQSSLSAEVSFLIMRDGSIRELDFARRSGRDDFDLNALGAVEAVGRAGGFGPLPSGFSGDALPISFYFTPTRQRP